MRNRKSKPEGNSNGHVANGDVQKPKKKTTRKDSHQDLLVYVLFGFFGIIFASGLFLFLSVDLVPEYERYPYERTKTESKDTPKGRTPSQQPKPKAAPEPKPRETPPVEHKASGGPETKKTVPSEQPKEQQNEIKPLSGWREASIDVLDKFDTTICNIERRNIANITIEEFERDYRYKKPLLVTFDNGADGWTVSEKWTVKSLKEEYGNAMLGSGNAREIVRKGGNGDVTSTFTDFVDKLISGSDSTGEPLYVFDRNFYNSSNLPKFIRPPEIFKITDGLDDSIFFLGGSKSGVSFHKHADTWNGVIFGRKRWFLYPMNHTPPGGVFTGYTMLEWFDLIYPKLADGPEADKPIECIQEAGEILYLPEGFYHGTINIGDTVAIGIQKKECEIPLQKLFYKERDLSKELSESQHEGERLERTQKLIDLYSEILKSLPESTEVMNTLAELYPQMDRRRAAMDMIDEVLKRDPYFLMAILGKIDLLKDINEGDKAIELAEEALRLNPDLYDTRVKYGQLLFDLERPEEAVYQFQKACELRPTELSHWYFLKRAQLGAGDEEAAQETDKIIDYLENYYSNE